MPPTQSILFASLFRVDASFRPPSLRSSILTSEGNPHPLGVRQTCRNRGAHPHQRDSSIQIPKAEETSSGDFDHHGQEGTPAGEFIPPTSLTSAHFRLGAGSNSKPLRVPFPSCKNAALNFAARSG
jgi:hypothetical protein